LATQNSASGKTFWDLPFGCHEADVCKWQVAKVVMPAQKFALTVKSGGGIILGGQICGGIIMIKVEWNDLRLFCRLSFVSSGRLFFSVGWRSTWSTDSIETILIISLKTGKVIGFIIGDDGRKGMGSETHRHSSRQS
jgi:hypothetical protein